VHVDPATAIKVVVATNAAGIPVLVLDTGGRLGKPGFFVATVRRMLDRNAFRDTKIKASRLPHQI